MQSHKYIIFCLLILVRGMSGQSIPETSKWESNNIHYTNLSPATKDDHNQLLFDRGLSSAFLSIYHVLISEADGNRCPFVPSCSGFFVQATGRTNLAEGVIIFMDRFTRDANWVNRRENYPFDNKTGRFSDSVERYILK